MSKRILIIDDDPLIRYILSSFLIDNYTVETKNNGRSALQWLKDGNIPDLILLDLEMPEMNGRVFIRRINSSSIHKDIPVIIISGTESNMLRNSFLKAGASDYIVKPFDKEQLLEVIEKVLQSK